MARILRGEIRLAQLDLTRRRDPTSSRPVVVLSQDAFNELSGTVIALAVTTQTQRAGFPLTLEIRCDGIGRRSWVKMGQIRTLSTHRIGRKLGRLSADQMDRLLDGLGEIIGR